jgi:hypothetical protein
MNGWRATFFGLKQIPRELTAFEIEAFLTFTAAERAVTEPRRPPALKLGLALQIGFLQMNSRALDAVHIVPAVLWRHLGEQFNVAAPDLASLRFMYRRAMPCSNTSSGPVRPHRRPDEALASRCRMPSGRNSRGPN